MTYTPERFQKLYEEFMQHEEDLLNWKAGEYTTNQDRIQNFREIAAFLGDKPIIVNPGTIALIYMFKHIQSIKNAVITGRVNWYWETPEGEGMKQRIADSRNYLALLAACLDEKNEEASNERLPDIPTKEHTCACGDGCKCRDKVRVEELRDVHELEHGD